MKLIGKSVYPSITMGPIFVLKQQEVQVANAKITDVKAEIARVTAAIDEAKAQIQKLYNKAIVEAGEESAAIFEVYRMMLEDDEYLDSIFNMIRNEEVNAEYAVDATGNTFAAIFSSMDDDYMCARSADVKDISERVVRVLSGCEDAICVDMESSIIVADDLSLSQMVQIDKSKCLAFVTVQGATNSHTAILARIMNIPALVMVPMEIDSLHTGMKAIVDGYSGEVTFEPTEEECQVAFARIKEEKEGLCLLEQMKGQETISKSGKKVHLYANINGINDVDYVLENDAEGIGLFRSEFLYLGRKSLPSEEEQYKAYKQVVTAMGDKKVIIRTLDIGADKPADNLNLEQEDNPALGYRAIRICLTQKEIFKTQLKALFRAAKYGNLAIMYPMIISTDEVEQIKQIVEEVKTELDVAGTEYQVPEQGIMIETPAAVMVSNELADMVDFFSIGTNDLTQYTLAIDRQNEKLDAFYNAHHPAVLRMIQMVIDNAHVHGIRVGICGELGADMELTEQFLAMGIDELSVAPSAVLKLRKLIREAE